MIIRCLDFSLFIRIASTEQRSLILIKMDLAIQHVSEVSWRADALQAVKLDPAVLEAKISVDTDLQTTKQESASDETVYQISKKSTEKCSGSSKSAKFEDMMRMQKAAVLSLSPQQFELLLKYTEILRMQRLLSQKNLECAFCKNNGEPASWYSIHMLRDREGRVRCPVLRGYRCPGCGATGDQAHTIKYCPLTDRDRWSC